MQCLRVQERQTSAQAPACRAHCIMVQLQQMQMSVANALLLANERHQAVKWATSASMVGAPCAEKLPYANFENPRQFRTCDLQVYTGSCPVAVSLFLVPLWLSAACFWPFLCVRGVHQCVRVARCALMHA